MTNPIDRIKALTSQADKQASAARDYKIFIQRMVDSGWTKEDVSDYYDKIKILMGKDDQAAFGLFADGIYKTADEARESAKQFWRECAA